MQFELSSPLVYRLRVSIPESQVASVVADISARMKDPNYPQIAIGHFVQAHPAVSQFLTAQMNTLGGGEAVFHAVFHSELIAECFRRELGRDVLPSVSFGDLDRTAGDGLESRLAEREPALAGYLTANVEEAPMRKVLAHVSLALAEAAAS